MMVLISMMNWQNLRKRLIEQALEKAGGSKTRAAELLKISYDSLHYRSEKLGIRP